MNVRRSWLFFLMMLLLSVCVVLLVAEAPIREYVRTIRGVPEKYRWQAVGAGSGDVAAAAGWEGDRLDIQYFTTSGELLGRQSLELPAEMTGGTVCRVCPIRENLVFLGLYGVDAEKLYLYRLNENGEAERLLAVDCLGDTFQERTSRTSLSELTYENGLISFALNADGKLERYRCRETGGLESDGTESLGRRKALSVVSAENGSLLVGGTNFFFVNGKTAEASFSGQSVTHLTLGRGGWYYVDADRFTLCFVDASFSSNQRVFSLDTHWDGLHRSLTSLAITREESVLMILDGTVLVRTDSQGTRELPGILSATPVTAWIYLAVFAVVAILVAVLLWFVLFALSRGYVPMVIARGSMFAAAAMICFTAVHFGYLRPQEELTVQRQYHAAVSAALQTAHTGTEDREEELCAEICRILEGSGADTGSNVRAMLVTDADGVWLTEDGRQAVTEEAFTPWLADEAQYTGTISALQGGRFRYVTVSEDLTQMLSIYMEKPNEEEDNTLSYLVLGSYGVLFLVALVGLLWLSRDIRKVSGRLVRLSEGGIPEHLELQTGDELESVVSMVNSLTASMQKQTEARESVEDSYRRFVPEAFLSLLGKETVQQVDKSTTAARTMTVMTVSFTFPESLYTDIENSRLLFDSVNEVIERTASIVSRKGGTVFHFTYNSFDVVIDDNSQAVSTAVAIQQEVLSFNELRTQDRLPAVTLRIAMDRGSVMLGIVGDASKLEPTIISSSLSTARSLLALCERLRAGILCTESVISERQEYNNRYMGKCLMGGKTIRLYEVFDGDEFSVRRGKEGSLAAFTQGVYDLYGGSVAAAKRTFLNLARSYPLDGGVRYYLYLADRLEHDPSLPCVLNLDQRDGGGKTP